MASMVLLAAVLPITGCGEESPTVSDATGAATGSTATAPETPPLSGEFSLVLVSADAAGIAANGSSGSMSISGDGAFVAFASGADNLVPGDTNGLGDVFRKDVATGSVIIISTSSSGAAANGSSGTSSTSGDGRFVAFWSEADNLIASDNNGVRDVFVKDTLTGETILASADADGAPGNGSSVLPSISDDGRYVAFRSAASNLVTGDDNGALDVYVRDLVTGVTVLASSDASGRPGNGDSSDTYPPSISADGRYVAFESAASSLVAGDGNGERDIFVKDLQTGAVVMASTTADGGSADHSSLYATISDDGSRVLFRSIAGNLTGTDPGRCGPINCSQVYLKDIDSGEIAIVSTDSAGMPANNSGFDPALSGNGRYAAFSTDADNLAPGDTNGVYDIFVKDVETGALYLVSIGSGGEPGDGWSIGPYLSADGVLIVFQSEASNLVPGDTNGEPDVLLAIGST